MATMQTINIPIADYSFEFPVIQTPGGLLVSPPNSNWTWGSTSGYSSGIVAENSNYTTGLTPPDGVQAAFLKGLGYFSQMVTLPADGDYWIYFYASQILYLDQAVAIYVDNDNIGTYSPKQGPYQQITTVEFPLVAGPHTISFHGSNATAEATLLIDNVTMQGILSDSLPSTTSIPPVQPVVTNLLMQPPPPPPSTATATQPSSASDNRIVLWVAISLASVSVLLGVALIFLILWLRRPRSKNPYLNLRQSCRSSRGDMTTNASTATSPRSTRIIREPEKAIIRPDSPTLPDVTERFGVGRFLALGAGRDTAPQPSAPPITNFYNDGMSNDSFWEKRSHSSLEKDTDLWRDLQL